MTFDETATRWRRRIELGLWELGRAIGWIWLSWGQLVGGFRTTASYCNAWSRLIDVLSFAKLVMDLFCWIRRRHRSDRFNVHDGIYRESSKIDHCDYVIPKNVLILQEFFYRLNFPLMESIESILKRLMTDFWIFRIFRKFRYYNFLSMNHLSILITRVWTRLRDTEKRSI